MVNGTNGMKSCVFIIAIVFSATPCALIGDTTRDDILESVDDVIPQLEKEMRDAVKALEFERAAEIRDTNLSLKQRVVFEY